MRLRFLVWAVLGLVILVTPGATAASPGSVPARLSAIPLAPAVHIAVYLGDCDLFGIAENINSFTLEHRSATGKLKARHTVIVTSGDWSVLCPGPRVVGGDRLRMLDAGSTLIRTFTVPRLRITTDRGHDRITGTAPRVTEVALVPIRCDVAFVDCTNQPEVSVPVASTDHRFHYHSPQDITGTWRVVIRWVGPHDTIYLGQRVAQLVVRPGSSMVGRTGRRAGDVAAVSVRRGDRLGLAAPTTNADASFTANVRRSGAPMKVRAGDLVSSSIAGDAVMTVPATSIELISGGVAGRCFKNAPVTTLVRDEAGALQTHITSTTGATGHWAVTVGLNAGWNVDAYCSNANGDAIRLHLVVS